MLTDAEFHRLRELEQNPSKAVTSEDVKFVRFIKNASRSSNPEHIAYKKRKDEDYLIQINAQRKLEISSIEHYPEGVRPISQSTGKIYDDAADNMRRPYWTDD